MEGTQFDLHTKRWFLILDAKAIRAFETQMGKGIFEVGFTSFSELVTIIWALARTNHPYLTLDAVFEVAQPGDFKLLLDTVKVFVNPVNMGFPTPSPDDAPPPPDGEASPPLGPSKT